MGLASKIQDKIKYGIGGRIFRPSVKVEPIGELVRLGSGYGGWTIEEAPYLKNCLAISCGLGEDASFDVEFANRYGAEVIIIDPTPRSVVHYQELTPRIGKPAERGYIGGGRQPAEAYDLSNVGISQLRFEEKALWINEDPIRFYKPANPAHVSHSIKFKPNTTGEDQFIVVPTVTIASLLADVPTERFALLKMDIEGAEVEILGSIADWPVLPWQILVEFDVLREPGNASKAEVERIDALLRAHSYVCRHFDGDRNYLYTR
ncbi:FkbM family methyltransferase [Sphingomonas oryzagri]